MKMKKIVIWALRILAVVVVIALSVRLSPLDQQTSNSFDPTQAIAHFWDNELPQLLQGDRVVDADLFRAELKNNRKLLVDRYGSTLGIGAPYSMLLGGEFEVVAVGEELTHIRTAQGAEFDLRTNYIFGNTAREATAAFNLISSELNRRIIEQVVAPQRDALTVGARLQVVGAIDLPQEGLPKGRFELIPLTLNLY